MNASDMDSDFLNYYCYNLVDLIQKYNISQVASHATCVDRIFQVLLRREKDNNRYNPLLLDLDGRTRWQVIAEVVRRIAMRDIPDTLRIQRILSLNYEALLTNYSVSLHPSVSRSGVKHNDKKLTWDDSVSEEQLELLLTQIVVWPPLKEWCAPNDILARLQSLFLVLREQEGRVILFVDHFHRLLGRVWEHYPFDAATLLKPVLARREIQLIGACNPTEYQKHIERDAPISRRMRELYL